MGRATQRRKIKESGSNWLSERGAIARIEGKWSEEIRSSYHVLQIKNGEALTEVKGLNLLAAGGECCFMTTYTKTKL